MKNRRSWWNEIRAHIAAKARAAFIYNLAKREQNFHGVLEFSHHEERMAMRVRVSPFLRHSNDDLKGALSNADSSPRSSITRPQHR